MPAGSMGFCVVVADRPPTKEPRQAPQARSRSALVRRRSRESLLGRPPPRGTSSASRGRPSRRSSRRLWRRGRRPRCWRLAGLFARLLGPWRLARAEDGKQPGRPAQLPGLLPADLSFAGLRAEGGVLRVAAVPRHDQPDYVRARRLPLARARRLGRGRPREGIRGDSRHGHSHGEHDRLGVSPPKGLGNAGASVAAGLATHETSSTRRAISHASDAEYSNDDRSR